MMAEIMGVEITMVFAINKTFCVILLVSRSVTLVVAFCSLPQNFGRWLGSSNTLLQYEYKAEW